MVLPRTAKVVWYVLYALRPPTLYCEIVRLYVVRLQFGAVFWPDYGRLSKNRAAWRVLGNIPSRNEPEVESGQLVLSVQLRFDGRGRSPSTVNPGSFLQFFRFFHKDLIGHLDMPMSGS